jgi:thiol-disulfide isomerase/thioredoxin
VTRPRRLIIAAIVAAAAVAFAVFGLKGVSTSGQAAPALPTTALAGSPVTLADLHGKPAFLVFWASWCEPCQHEAPAIERFSRSVGARAHVVGVNWNDPNLGGAQAFLRRYGWSFPSLRDADGLVGDRLGLHNLPTTYLINSSGHVAQTLTGEQTQQSLSAALARLQ